MKEEIFEKLYFVDYYLDNKHINTFAYGLVSDFDCLADVFYRALCKIEYLYHKFKKSDCKCFYATLKDKQNNLIFEFKFDFGGLLN